MVSYSSGYWQQLYLFPPLLLAGEREREEMSNESSDVPYILVPPSFELCFKICPLSQSQIIKYQILLLYIPS